MAKRDGKRGRIYYSEQKINLSPFSFHRSSPIHLSTP